jgi:hypothetical protein
MDLTDELERSIPTGPTTPRALPTPTERLRLGRQVRRRRRLAAGGAVLAVGALVAGGVAVADLSTEQTPTAARSRPAGTDASGPPHVLFRTQQPITQFSYDDQAFYDTDGVLVVRDDAQELRRVDNPQRVAAPAQSVGLVTRWHGKEYWTFAWGRGGEASSDSVAVDDLPAPATFEQWLADLSAQSQVWNYDAQYVALSPGGTLTPTGTGVTVLSQTTDVPAGMRHPGAPAAVGVVAVGAARLCVGAAGDEFSYQSAREHGPGLAGCTVLFEHWEHDVD